MSGTLALGGSGKRYGYVASCRRHHISDPPAKRAGDMRVLLAADASLILPPPAAAATTAAAAIATCLEPLSLSGHQLMCGLMVHSHS